jgi:hypothetical protein
MKTCRLFLGVMLTLFLAGAAAAAKEEYAFEESEIEKKPYQVGGYVEFRPTLFGLDKGASLYKTNLFDKSVGGTLMQYNARLWIDAKIEKEKAGFYLQLNTDYTQSDVVSATSQTRAYQAYLSLKPSSSLTVDAGKKTSKWGKGYAWNPAAFVDRPKDPDDPELALEGYGILSADYIRSFSSGPLRTFSFTPVLLPSTGDINDDFGATDHLNVAAKAYFLLYDTDIDFMFLAGGSRTARYGFDFSRNVGTNLEVHGEFALITGSKKTLVEPNGTVRIRDFDAVNYVVGTRYLSSQNTTYILEYYYQGSGYSPREMSNFFAFADKSYDTFLANGDARAISRARSMATGNYGRFTPEMHYLYFRASQPEPFDILYFTPAIYWICNVSDRSFQVTPELLYMPVTDLELRLRTSVLVAGQRNSEFGEKQNDYRVELRMRYYF